MWRRICDPKKIAPIRALSTENVVFDVATRESPSVSAARIYFGTGARTPRVNNRQKWTTAQFRTLSNTNQNSTFVHTCIKCTGQHGKVLQFPSYLIRIGRYNIPQALLNTIRFVMFYNQRTFTSMAAPNTVATGVFWKQLDRKSLVTDAQANEKESFPGIYINLRSHARCTPGLHTNNPSRFIVPGCRSIHDLKVAAEEISDIAKRHTLADNGPAAPGGGKSRKRRRVGE